MNNFHMREGKVEFRWKRWRNKKRQEVSSCLMVLFSGMVLLGAGGVALAGADGIEQLQKALRLNPRPVGWYYGLLGQAQYVARQYDNAVGTLRKEETYRTASRRILAAS